MTLNGVVPTLMERRSVSWEGPVGFVTYNTTHQSKLINVKRKDNTYTLTDTKRDTDYI